MKLSLHPAVKKRIPVLISQKFEEAKSLRYTKYFRYDNSKYWQDYYSKKLKKHDVSREQMYAQIIQSHIGKKGKVIDVGCGIGFFAKELADVGLDVTGADLFDEMLDQAKKYLKDSNVNLIKADVINLPFQDNSFDCVSVMSLIEHFPQAEVTEDLLPSLSKIIRPGGYLFVHVPVRSLHSRFARFFRKYIVRDLPPWAIDDDGDITHKMWMSASKYINLITPHGFELVNYDSRLTRSNLKPKALSVLSTRLQKEFEWTDPQFKVSLLQEPGIIRAGKLLKSQFALTSYFLFKKI
jgi:2-polyprenyl-3-methyl-5-hydroxy-6-metoxy-1,4-benzoquinol methylase